MLTADSVCQRCGGERSEKIDCFVIHASPTLKSGSKHAVQQHSDEARGGWNPELGAGNDSTPRRDECNQHTRSESGDCARNRDPAVGAGCYRFPGGNENGGLASGLPDFTGYGVGGSLRQRRRRRKQPGAISCHTESHRAKRSHGEICQHLPGISSVTALGDAQVLLSAISEASGNPDRSTPRRTRASRAKPSVTAPAMANRPGDEAHPYVSNKFSI